MTYINFYIKRTSNDKKHLDVRCTSLQLIPIFFSICRKYVLFDGLKELSPVIFKQEEHRIKLPENVYEIKIK